MVVVCPATDTAVVGAAVVGAAVVGATVGLLPNNPPLEEETPAEPNNPAAVVEPEEVVAAEELGTAPEVDAVEVGAKEVAVSVGLPPKTLCEL